MNCKFIMLSERPHFKRLHSGWSHLYNIVEKATAQGHKTYQWSPGDGSERRTDCGEK